VPESGVGISSIDVDEPGFYRPTVTISAPPSGVTATAIAIMSATGTISSIEIIDGGSGYITAPSVTIQAAVSGGTTSTGWTATLTAGRVTAISGGSAGDYRPTITISSGGGTGATATTTLNTLGSITGVMITAAGSGYTSEPTISITPKIATGSITAQFTLHMGTETVKCKIWDGVTPGGYNPATPSTYPILGDGTNPYFSLPVPSADGTTTVENVVAECLRCTACP
jgi:hypothetical protein